MVGLSEGRVLLLLLALVLLYFLPTIAALRRKHHERVAILALNLLLGWTVFGWIGALVWAYTATQPAPSKPQASAARYCMRCGSPATDASFCPRCGTAPAPRRRAEQAAVIGRSARGR